MPRFRHFSLRAICCCRYYAPDAAFSHTRHAYAMLPAHIQRAVAAIITRVADVTLLYALMPRLRHAATPPFFADTPRQPPDVAATLD